jgi:hypothetical protein
MKTKLLALLLMAGGSVFAAHVSIGVGIGVAPLMAITLLRPRCLHPLLHTLQRPVRATRG